MISNLLLTSQLQHWLKSHAHLLPRILIITSVLLSTIALAFNVPQIILLLIPGLLIGLLIIRVIMEWPILGILAIIGSIVIPFNGPSGVNATMGLVVLLLGLWIMNLITRRNAGARLATSKPIWPLLALILVACLALIMGMLPWYSYFAQPAPLVAQLGGLAIYILSISAFLLTAHQIREIRWLEWMTWIFLIMGTVFIVGLLVPSLRQFTSIVFPPGSTGSILWVWLVALASSQAFFNQDLHILKRLLLFCLTTVTLYVALVNRWAWNSGWVPALATFVTILLIIWPRLLWILSGAIIIGITINLRSVIDAIMVGDNAYSLSTRLEAWTLLWDMVKVNPILGLGPANYRWFTPLFPIRGWAVHFVSHNQYIDLIAQTGLLGLIFYLWAFGALAVLGWKLRNRVPDGFPRAYILGALGGLAGTLVSGAFGDWVIPFFYNIGMSGFRTSMLAWLFLGGLVALDSLYPKNHNQDI